MVDRVRPLFPLGQCVATPGALAALEEAGQTPADFLNRHVCGDWGEIHPADKGMNEQALTGRGPHIQRLPNLQGRKGLGHHRGRSCFDLHLAARRILS